MYKSLLLILGFFCCTALSDYYDDDGDFGDYVPFIGYRRDEFDWKLMKVLTENDSANFVVSPFSLKVVLMMLAEMSDNYSKTMKELFTALDGIKTLADGRSVYKNYLKSLLAYDSENDLRCGNAVIVSKTLQTRGNIKAILENAYQASVNKTDLKDIAAATKQINDWVSELTDHRIETLVDENNVKDSVVMLVNALYFEGHWKSPFKSKKTTQAIFTTQQGGQSPAAFMNDRGDYYYFESVKLQSKLLRIPYAGQKYAMFIILPYGNQTVRSVAPLLDHKTINREAWYLDELTVDVKLPKFNINYAVDFKPYLKALGVNTIFTSEASLGKLARGVQPDGSQLIVSNVIQKTAIDVNEEGSTAAAATAAQLVNKFGGGPKQFHADRPFLFYIEDEITGNVIFAGQVSDPSLTS